MPALADVLGSNAKADARAGLVAGSRRRQEIAAAEIAPRLGNGDQRRQHHRADVQHAGAVNVVQLEALHLRAVCQRGVRCRETLARSPHGARGTLIDGGKSAAQDAAPFEVGAIERAAERVEHDELQSLAHLDRDGVVLQTSDVLREAACVIHSGRMPAARTTLATRATSALMWAPNSSGVLPMTSAPSAARRFATSGCLSALMMPPCSLSITSRGVPAGARMPYQDPDSYSGRPDSASVGTFGRSAERLRLGSSMAPRFPGWMGGPSAATVPNMSCTSPRRGTVPGGAPP